MFAESDDAIGKLAARVLTFAVALASILVWSNPSQARYVARAALQSVLAASGWTVQTPTRTVTARISKPTISGTDCATISARLHQIADAGNLSDLRWPDFSDHRMDFARVYEASDFNPVWLHDDQPDSQALSLIRAFSASAQKGLNPEDYDAPRWSDRLAALKRSATADELARFDAALTVTSLRYISDLHVGRVDPKHFSFGIDIAQKQYDLPQFVTDKVIHAVDLSSVLAGIEPPYDGYKRTEIALQHYIALSEKGDGTQFSVPRKPIEPGDTYFQAPQLAERLSLLGDLQSPTIPTGSAQYSGTLVEAVEHFQTRHGLSPSGKIDADTVRALNVPLASRIRQLQDALERWRWVPSSFPQPPVVVNIPEFELRAFAPAEHVVLSMNVVVGRALRTQTPVFACDMRYVVFRPYWNVPPNILRSEIIPAIAKNRKYISDKHYEVTDRDGNVITRGAITDDVLAQLRTGRLAVRQMPGPTNALGLIKFIFPNDKNVYLHSTPAPQLFSRVRRDFSHGCIRIQKPAELAVWVFSNQPGQSQWTLEKVQGAMQSGPDNQQVNLAVPIPVLIMYVTAVVERDNSVHFFDDIYGHDKALEETLAKGQPYLR